MMDPPKHASDILASPSTVGQTSTDDAHLVTVAEGVARWLRALGVDTAFAMHSHHLVPLLPALWSAGIRIHVAASETGAGYMADGYARASGRLGVAITGGGPGLAMMIPALQTAFVEGVPVLALVGQNATSGIPNFQETDSSGSRDVQILRGLMAAVAEVRHAPDLPAALETSATALVAGGPAAIAIPVDVQAQALPIPVPMPTEPFAWKWHSRHSEAPAMSGDGLTRPAQSHLVEPATSHETPVTYRDVLAAVAASASGARVFVDAGQARHAAHSVLDPLDVDFIDCPCSAPMGWAIAASIGAALPAGDTRPVVCVTGDGSALMLGNEFSTAVRYEADVTFIICANGVWGGPYSRHRGSPSAEMGSLPAIDWLTYAASLGLPVRRIESAVDLDRVLRDQQERGPLLLVVPTPPKDDDVRAPYAAAPSLTQPKPM